MIKKDSKSTPRTTVLHMALQLNPSATMRALVELAVLTQRGGWRALIASSGGALVTEAERAAVRHSYIPLHKQGWLNDWRNFIQLETLGHRTKPDLIHVHGTNLLPLACRLARYRKVPLLIDLIEPVAPQAKLQHQIAQSLSHGAFIRVPSHYLQQQLSSELNLPANKIYQVPSGLDLNWHDPARISPERIHALSQIWRLPETASIIITATPATQGQGHPQLLQALGKLQRRDLFLVIVGPHQPSFTAEIERLVHLHKLEGQVIMPDYCPDWAAACWLASTVVAANQNPRGHAPELMVAQALGRPVIATNCGANPELVQAGETAWLIPTDNQNALQDALAEATRLSTDQRLDLAQRTRQFALDHFPQAAWSGSMFEIYAALLSQPMQAQPTHLQLDQVG